MVRFAQRDESVEHAPARREAGRQWLRDRDDRLLDGAAHEGCTDTTDRSEDVGHRRSVLLGDLAHVQLTDEDDHGWEWLLHGVVASACVWVCR